MTNDRNVTAVVLDRFIIYVYHVHCFIYRNISMTSYFVLLILSFLENPRSNKFKTLSILKNNGKRLLDG